MFTIPVALATPVIYALTIGDGASMLLPTARHRRALARARRRSRSGWPKRILEPAERLDRARVVLEDAYTRARAESLRDALTGLGNHRAFQEELERQWVGSTRYNSRLALAILDLDDFGKVNEAEGHAAATGSSSASPDCSTAGLAPRRPGLPDRWRRVRRADARRGRRRCLPGAAPRPRHGAGARRRTTAADRTRTPSSRGRSRSASPPHPAPRPIGPRSTARPTRRWPMARSTAGRASRSSTPDRHGSPGMRARPSPVARRWSPRSRRPVRSTRSSSRSSTCGPGGRAASRRSSGRCPAPASPTRPSCSPRPRPFGRTVELDLASLTTSIAAFARLAAAGQPDPQHLAAIARVRPVQRPRPCAAARTATASIPRRIVLELTEREAVEDMDRLSRAVDACRAAGMRIAADDVGAGNAGLRLLSQLRFDIVKIDLSLVQGGVVRATSQEVVRDPQGPRRPVGRAGHRRGHRDRRAARIRPVARHPRRSGLPARACRGERPSTDDHRPRRAGPDQSLRSRGQPWLRIRLRRSAR